MKNREALARVQAATVAIAYTRTPKDRHDHPFGIIGSGLCIDRDGFIVTSRHVTDHFMVEPLLEFVKAATPTAILPDGQRFFQTVPEVEPLYAAFCIDVSDHELGFVFVRAHPIVTDGEHDLALLLLESKQSQHFPDGCPTVEIAQPEEVYEGDEVGLCGYPLVHFLYERIGTVTSSLSKGIVSSIIPARGTPRDHIQGYQLDIGAAQGNSGGPAFLWDSGRVFGVLERGALAEEEARKVGADHLNKATPLHRFLDSIDLDVFRHLKPGEIPSRINRGTPSRRGEWYQK